MARLRVLAGESPFTSRLCISKLARKQTSGNFDIITQPLLIAYNYSNLSSQSQMALVPSCGINGSIDFNARSWYRPASCWVRQSLWAKSPKQSDVLLLLRWVTAGHSSQPLNSETFRCYVPAGCSPSTWLSEAMEKYLQTMGLNNGIGRTLPTVVDA